MLSASLLAAAAPLARTDPPPFSVTMAGVTADDVAAALGQRWWSYELEFAEPVGLVSVQFVELRRQADGSWERTLLAPGQGRGSQSADIERLDLKLAIQDGRPAEYVMKLGNAWFPGQFTTAPDFERTYRTPTVATFVDGCLILAIEEQDPNHIYQREQDMVRVIGLEITTTGSRAAPRR